MPDDELIDRAAHALTRGEPSPQLRHAIRARIDPGRPGLFGRPGLASQARRVWIPVAAAVVLVISIVLARTLSGPRDAQLPSSQVATSSRVTPPVALQPTPRLPVGRPVVTPVVTRRRSTPRRNLVVDPLVIEPISVPLIAIDSSSGVMPMEIQPLQIEPLQPQ